MRTRPPNSQSSPAYNMTIRLGNTHRGVLEEIQKNFGGTLTFQPARRQRWKDLHTLMWSAYDAERIIKLLVPHLIVKAPQAKILLEFAEHKHHTKRGSLRIRGKNVRLDYDTLRIREDFYKRIRVLNFRGRAGGTADLIRAFGDSTWPATGDPSPSGPTGLE
jgi:hypothetical protein